MTPKGAAMGRGALLAINALLLRRIFLPMALLPFISFPFPLVLKSFDLP
jgi:hypothetical protein